MRQSIANSTAMMARGTITLADTSGTTWASGTSSCSVRSTNGALSFPDGVSSTYPSGMRSSFFAKARRISERTANVARWETTVDLLMSQAFATWPTAAIAHQPR